MDTYELYCLADPVFYDRLQQRHTEETDFALGRRPAPAGWQRHDTDTWLHFAPAAAALPPQGWKVHISATVQDAERAVEAAWEYCVPRGIAFKFLRGTPALVMQSAKSAPRGGSGKLVTIYPADEAEFALVLTDLDRRLRGVRGPYILSDLRYGEGPLYVRYGGFADRRTVAANGERVSAVQRPDGTLVPDERNAVFGVPDWVTLPAFLEPHLAARNAVTTTGLPYSIESVLHFSNGGGVYLARDTRTDRRVVLKEGRPHAGLDASGRDAVARLRHERDILERLVGLDVVPALRDYFTLGEHEFLVQDFVDGNPLQRLLVHRYPLTRATCTEPELAAYTDWAAGVLDRVEAAVAALHGRGVVFGDLHPDNILMADGSRPVLIDFEVATLVTADSRPALAHPAFGAPGDRRGTAADDYALACLTFGLFAPQATIMLQVDRGKTTQLADLITETFPVPADRIAAATATILGDRAAGTAPDWTLDAAALRRAILASATPGRPDRLYPGDVAQFSPGGATNVAHGAAGVLYALHATGAGVPAEHVDWLAARVLRPEQGAGIGLYDGLLGAAHVLDLLDRPALAREVADRCLAEPWESLELDLYSGIAGIGLVLLDLAPDLAERAVGLCADRLPESTADISGGAHPRAGLMYGAAGPALLFLHAYERCWDPALLDLAAHALRLDLHRCLAVGDGTLQVNQGWRHLPYLAEGAAGIALVLARYLAHRPDDALAERLDPLRRVADCGYFVQPGLFAGRAGILAALERDDPRREQQLRGLRWHAMPHGGGLAFPGDRLLRLSMDLATGTAGVLLAVGRASLPYLGPPCLPGTPERRSFGLAADHDTREEV